MFEVQVMEAFKRVVKEGHPDTLISINSLPIEMPLQVQRIASNYANTS